MKKIIPGLLLCIFILFLSACGKSEKIVIENKDGVTSEVKISNFKKTGEVNREVTYSCEIEFNYLDKNSYGESSNTLYNRVYVLGKDKSGQWFTCGSAYLPYTIGFDNGKKYDAEIKFRHPDWLDLNSLEICLYGPACYQSGAYYDNFVHKWAGGGWYNPEKDDEYYWNNKINIKEKDTRDLFIATNN